MGRRYNLFIPLGLMVGDLAMINLSFLLAYYIRFLTNLLPQAQEFHQFADYSGVALLNTVLFPLLLAGQGAYRMKRSPSGFDELTRIFTVVSVGTVVAMAMVSFVSPDFNYSRGLLSLGWILGILMIWVHRMVQYGIHSWLRRHGWAPERVIIVGTGEMARAIRQRIAKAPRLGYTVLGLVGDSDCEEGSVLGPVEEIGSLVRSKGATEVIIAEPSLTHRDILDLVSKCDKERVNIKVFPDVFQIMTSEAAIGDLDGLPMVSIRDAALRGWSLIIKRAMDVVISAAFLVVLSPLMLATAILIKITSPNGPTFYLQERVGLDGKPFQVIKFRSMRPDAEAHTGPVWAGKEDPRATRLGAFLRRWSIDETPQFINVLLGEMSMVGPRPERPVFVEEFSHRVPRYLERHKEKAGLTGWAQVHGLRGQVSIEERTAYDLWYVEHWTVWLDIKIILLTILEILKGENAY
ncbi:MAG: undecaprenyl-phosphate glucose phosphotransferase [Dehalococcoidia bacterium]|nr:undecaprenyl-phosphate glucose phosphotransferase [Dehalococcoidia bacterium]